MRGLALALLLIAGCRTTESLPPDRLTLSFGSDEAPGYSIAIPCDFVRRDVQGIDSEVARFEGPGLHLDFDYGWYGGFAECAGRAGCREWEETIGGRRWELSLAAPDVDVDGPFTRFLSARVRLGERTSLAIGAGCIAESDCERALAVVRTVRFGSPPGS